MPVTWPPEAILQQYVGPAFPSRGVRPQHHRATGRGGRRMARAVASYVGLLRRALVCVGGAAVPEAFTQLRRPRSPSERNGGRPEALFAELGFQSRGRGAAALRRARGSPVARARPRAGCDAVGAPRARRAAHQRPRRRGGHVYLCGRAEAAVASRATGPPVPDRFRVGAGYGAIEEQLRGRNWSLALAPGRAGRGALHRTPTLPVQAGRAARRPTPLQRAGSPTRTLVG